MACALLSSADIVRPDWLKELVRLGSNIQDPNEPSTLEQEFRLPDVSQYLPDQSSSLPGPLRAPNLWAKNESRKAIFKGWRFLFAGKSGEIDSELRKLVELGEGEYEAFDASGGLARWEQALSRNKRKAEGDGGKGITVIGDKDALRLTLADAAASFFETLRK